MFEELIVVVRRAKGGHLEACIKQMASDGPRYGKNLIGRKWGHNSHIMQNDIRWKLNGKAKKVTIEYE